MILESLYSIDSAEKSNVGGSRKHETNRTQNSFTLSIASVETSAVVDNQSSLTHSLSPPNCCCSRSGIDSQFRLRTQIDSSFIHVRFYYFAHPSSFIMTTLGYLRSVREWAYPTRTSSAFLEKGVLTPEEFVRAGDELCFRCPTCTLTQVSATLNSCLTHDNLLTINLFRFLPTHLQGAGSPVTPRNRNRICHRTSSIWSRGMFLVKIA